MKKHTKVIILFEIIILCMSMFKVVYAEDQKIVTITNWSSLKNAVENNDALNLEVLLSDEESNAWDANSKITIKSGQNVTLIANASITIKRANNFLDSMFENSGTLDMKTLSSQINFVLDGNKENVQATNSLITVNNGILNMNNVTMQNNYRINGNGGAIFAISSNIEIENSTFQGNEAHYGGAIFTGSLTCNTRLNNVRILDNKTLIGSGGGIYAYGELTINGDNTLISNNTAYTYGGGVMVKTNATLNAGEISNNKALTYAGGGIRVDGTLTMNGGKIKNNTANTSGGGIDWTPANANLVFNSGTIENNIANGGKEAGDNIYPYAWKEEGKLNLKEIDTELIRNYLKGSGKDIQIANVNCGLQGMAASDKYIIMALVYPNDSLNTNIVIIDRNTMEVLNTDSNYCFGHSNGMTYNPNDDRFYVTYNNPNDDNYYITGFKVNDNYEIDELINIVPARYYSKITYNTEENRFICGAGNTIYILDENWNELRSFNTYITVGTQDITYYKGYIYSSAWESGSSYYHKVYNTAEKNSNLIYVYNLEGELQETMYLPNTKINAELEDVYIDSNGRMILAFNGPSNGPSLYKSSYLMEKIKPEVTISYSKTEITNQDVVVTISVNEEVQEIEGWTLSADKMRLTKIYSKNTEDTVEVTDLAGNITKANIKIQNIDKDKDKEVLTKTYTENAEEEVPIKDAAGNSSTAKVSVSNIDKTEKVEPNKSSNISKNAAEKTEDYGNSGEDITMAKKALPQTGEGNVLMVIGVVMIIAVITFIKFKSYRDIR